ncbi:hypothetical protein [Paraflavitalea sp. CAU 1676]|uniref:hypothetical protein n=1 Tax=Paraflavitalea sp. CAU 1676 TaxID=3032598 RepID=UPI0023D98B2D|nr:hypothetical protein [Paraflavitalea sp. CAU 1676]MDF2188546.1 hypothetical protein [Paraflavitalea sp. CAU 1676]
MQNEVELLKVAKNVEKHILHEIILVCLGESRILRGSDSVLYSFDVNSSLTIYYDGKDTLVNIVSVNMIEEIRTRISERIELVKVKKKLIGHVVLFCSSPVLGFFKFEDRFQIRPVPDDAPKAGSVLMNLHPFILEYKYDGFEDVFANQALVSKLRENYCCLFSTLLSNSFSLENYSNWSWVVEQDGPAESKLLQNGYFFRTDQLTSDKFSNTSQFEPIKIEGVGEYSFGIKSIGDYRFRIPDYFICAIDKYYSVAFDDKREIFNESMYWYCKASRELRQSVSATCVFIGMSLEKLTKYEKPQKCGVCEESNIHFVKLKDAILNKFMERSFENEKISKEMMMSIVESKEGYYCKSCGSFVAEGKSSSKLIVELFDKYYPVRNEFLTKIKSDFYPKFRSFVAHGSLFQSDKKRIPFPLDVTADVVELYLSMNKEILISWLINS